MLSYNYENRNSMIFFTVLNKEKDEIVEEKITSYLYRKKEDKNENNNNKILVYKRKNEREIEYISKPKSFGGGKPMIEYVAEAARKRIHRQKWSYNNTNKVDTKIESSTSSDASFIYCITVIQSIILFIKELNKQKSVIKKIT